jgi:hypothetical protein
MHAGFQDALVRALREVGEDQRRIPGRRCGTRRARLLDADLGGGIIKQRVARPGAGKRGGYRAIIAYVHGHRAVFLLGFAKSARDNIAPDQLADLKEAASELLALSNGEVAQRLDARTLEEADYDENP